MNTIVQRGQIWYAELNGIGSVQNSIHPIVVVSNRLNNLYSPTICIVPLTSKVKRLLPTHVLLDKSTGIAKDSIILCEQIQTIDKSQLKNYIGIELNDNYMQKIERAMMIQLGLITNQSKELKVI